MLKCRPAEVLKYAGGDCVINSIESIRERQARGETCGSATSGQ
jgi:hypothetical protein